MRILLVGARADEFTALAGAMRERGHDAAATTADDAVARVPREPPDLVIADAAVAAAHDFALVRAVRAIAAPAYAYVAVLGDLGGDGAIVAAYKAGIDADLPRPLGAARLVTLLLVAERVARDAHARTPAMARQTAANSAPNGAANATANGAVAANGQGAPTAAASPRPAAGTDAASRAAPAGGLPPVDMVCVAPAWQQAPSITQETASRFLTLPVTIERTAVGMPGAGYACQVVLANVQQQVELRVAIACDTRGAQALAVHLFGDSDPELAADVLSELVNMFMGALKTSFSDAGVAFAAGVPSPIGPALVAQPEVTFQRQEFFSLAIAESRVFVHLGVRNKGNVLVSSGALSEGAVLAKDVFNARGLLLVKGGTRLSTNMIEHIQSILPPRQMVEVMAP